MFWEPINFASFSYFCDFCLWKLKSSDNSAESVGGVKTFWKLLVCWIRLLWKSLWKVLDNLNKLLLPFQLTIDQCQRTINQDISTRPLNESCEMSMHKCPLHHVTTTFMDWFLNLCRLPRDLYAHLYRLSLSSWFTSSICQTEILKYCREFCANIILSSLILLTLLHLFLPSE